MSDSSQELYLIAHKVRGELAFDVATKLQIGKEEGWIIPTSGHRAYPFWWSSLDLLYLRDEVDISLVEAPGQMPEGLRDHYQFSQPLSSPVKRKLDLNDLDLEELGL